MTEFPTAQFHEWLAKQPGERRFNYWDTRDCMFCAFARESLGWFNVTASMYRIYQSVRGECWTLIPSQLVFASAEFRDAERRHFTVQQFRHELSKQKEQAV